MTDSANDRHSARPGERDPSPAWRPSQPAQQPQEPQPEPQSEPPPGSDGEPRSGRDLAREALRAAQQAAAARGRGPGETAKPGRWRRSGGRGGRRRGWSGARPDDRDPQPLGRVAARLAADRGWKDQLTSASVFGRWSALVGADVAEHATPVSLKDGELVVQATSTAWATQLRTLQRQLLVKIAAGVGPGVVRSLKVQGPAAPSWRKGPRTVRGRGPRDTYG